MKRLKEESYTTLIIIIFKLSFRDEEKIIIYVYSSMIHKNTIKVLNLSKEM